MENNFVNQLVNSDADNYQITDISFVNANFVGQSRFYYKSI